MRILVLIHEFPPVGGGGGRVAQDLCQGLAQRGHQVHVLTAGFGNLPTVENQHGVEIQRLRSFRRESYRAGLLAMAGYVMAAAWSGIGSIRRIHPDVIHVHFAVPAGAAAWILSILTGVPYVLTAHLGDVPGGVPEKTGKWFRWVFPFTKPIWKRASRVVAVSEFTRKLAEKHYPVSIEVIPNGVDLDVINPGEIQVSDPPLVVFAGRFVPQKNPMMIVRCLEKLRDIPWTCALIGDGVLRSEVAGEIARLGLQDRFILPGWLPPAEVLTWFSKSDVLFLPSRSEGLPVVGIQAMAMGLALVLSRVGGNVDLVEERLNGYLIEVDDQLGYENSLRELLTDPAILLAARRASRNLAYKFDLNAIITSYENILERKS